MLESRLVPWEPLEALRPTLPGVGAPAGMNYYS
jgi:hypothetical protein